MQRLLVAYLVSVLLVGTGCSQNRNTDDRVVGGPCNRCDLMFEGMPANIMRSTKITPTGEPGEPLIIQGTIYQKDGKTPAPGIILYVYHTDVTGKYAPAQAQISGKIHGHLRGWMNTDAQGRYQFMTIRPAAYPSRTAPQHIHAIIKEPRLSLYWIDEYLFDDDPLLTPEKKEIIGKRGGPGIIHLAKNEKGEWIGHRDIILGLNIPDY